MQLPAGQRRDRTGPLPGPPLRRLVSAHHLGHGGSRLPCRHACHRRQGDGRGRYRGPLSAQKWPSCCRSPSRRSVGCWPRWCGGWRTIPVSCWPGQAGGGVTKPALAAATGDDANASEKCGCSTNQQWWAHRCAQGRFPRSLPTVRAEVMRSNNLASGLRTDALHVAAQGMRYTPSPARRSGCRVGAAAHRRVWS